MSTDPTAPASTPAPATESASEAPTPASEPSAGAARRRVRFDLVLAALVLLLAFMLASAGIAAPQFWLHLATGRYLANNLSQIGVDPFLFTSEGVLWVNHTWLYDLIIYGIYTLAGGAGLVVLHALLIAVMAAIMLRLRPAGGSLWIGVVCVGLALLAMALRLPFNPLGVSLLLLSLTTYLLLRSGNDASSNRHLWILPLLFILWVNMDVWFILGPLCVLLALLGQALATYSVPATDAAVHTVKLARLRILGLVFVAGLVACLVNPFGYHALTLPMEFAALGPGLPEQLSPAGSVFLQAASFDDVFRRDLPMWASPLVIDAWSQPMHGPNLWALAYWFLVFGGIASFMAYLILDKDTASRQSVWPRLLIWIAFLLLGLWMARLIPLFAVVAGPITAWNWQEFGLRLKLPPSRNILGRGWPILGRALTTVAVLALLVLSWPGWVVDLIGVGSSRYRVHWGIIPDPGLVQSAADLKALQEKEQQQGHTIRILNFAPALACYCAWYSPEIKSFYDSRYGLLRGKGADLGFMIWGLRRQYEQVEPQYRKLHAEKINEMRGLLGKYQISHVAFTEVARDTTLARIVSNRIQMPEHWTLAGSNGSLAVFRWSEIPTTLEVGPTAGLNFGELAFGGSAKKLPRPGDAMVFPQPTTSLDKYLFGSPKTSLATERALFYTNCYQALMAKRVQMTKILFELPAAPELANLGGDIVTLAPALGPMARINTLEQRATSFLAQAADRGPPGLSLLAVQAARQGVQEAPNDFESYWQLFHAYENLAQDEGLWGPQLKSPTFRDELRVKQMITALHNASLLRPDKWEVQIRLAHHALQMNYLDIALEHFQEAKTQLDKTPIHPMDKERNDLRTTISKNTQNLAKDVEVFREIFHTYGKGLTPVEQALFCILPPEKLPPQLRQALEKMKINRSLGLAGEALRILSEEDLDSLPAGEAAKRIAQNASLRLEILTTMGRMQEVAELLYVKRLGESLGLQRVMFIAHLAAAMGDYALFEQQMKALDDDLLKSMDSALPAEWLSIDSPISNPAGVASLLGLTGDAAFGAHPLMLAGSFGLRFEREVRLLGQAPFGLRFLGEVRMVRGLMALEAGDPARAEILLQSAVRLVDPDFAYLDYGVAENYLRQVQEVRKKG